MPFKRKAFVFFLIVKLVESTNHGFPRKLTALINLDNAPGLRSFSTTAIIEWTWSCRTKT